MTLPQLQARHVRELRHFAAVDGLTRDQLGLRDPSRVRDLEAHGLLTWDGGAGKDGDHWRPIGPGKVRPTVAGLAALALYDLGCERLVADSMTAGKAKR